MTTVYITDSDKSLPDASLSFDGETYTFAITGLTGLVELPRLPRADETERGIISLDPPTVQATDTRGMEALMLQALEVVTPDEHLMSKDPDLGRYVYDPTHLMLAHITRVFRRLLWKLEPPA